MIIEDRKMTGKKINKLIFITVIFGMCIFFTNEKVFGQNWILINRSSNTEEWYIDSNSIEEVSSTSKRVWAKMIISPEEKIKINIKYNLPTAGYSSFSHSLIYYEIDCLEKSCFILSIIEYDKSGSILYRSEVIGNSNTFIVPGSIYESMYKAVCP